VLKNVTITLEEDLLREARIMAAKQNTSVSRLLALLLEEKVRRTSEYWAAFERFKQITPVFIPGLAENRLSREEANERKP